MALVSTGRMLHMYSQTAGASWSSISAAADSPVAGKVRRSLRVTGISYTGGAAFPSAVGRAFEPAVAEDNRVHIVFGSAVREAVAAGFERAGDLGGEAAFEIEFVGEPLVVDTGRVDGVLGIPSVFRDEEQDLRYRGGNGGTARGAEHGFRAAGAAENRRGHGGDGTLAGGDGIDFALHDAVLVRLAGAHG